MSEKALKLDPQDNVATALQNLAEGEVVIIETGEKIGIALKDSIDFGHKFAIRKISPREKIIKYGEAIGVATKEIDRGKHVHVHNVDSIRGKFSGGRVR